MLIFSLFACLPLSAPTVGLSDISKMTVVWTLLFLKGVMYSPHEMSASGYLKCGGHTDRQVRSTLVDLHANLRG